MYSNKYNTKMTGQRGRPRKGQESNKLWSNKDYVSNYNKEYYERRKNDADASIQCECKKVVAKNYIEKHRQSQYHKNVMKVLDELA